VSELLNPESLRRSLAPYLTYPPVFVTVSGAHLYGFPSPDSDVDLRGAYLMPLEAVVGLYPAQETITCTFDEAGREIDLVAHDLHKFLRLLLKRNGYVLEQLYSPLVVQGSAALDELRVLARDCITRHVYHHYAGFARHQIQRLEAESPPSAKTLLYVYRVLLTGIWLLRTGEVEANLRHLNATFRLHIIPELIAQKQAEHAVLLDIHLDNHQHTIAQLQAQLETAFQESGLPEEPANVTALNDFLVQLRREGLR
jgi:predicted nucleotidyltransferase